MTRFNTLPRGHVVARRFVIESAIGRGRTSAVYKALDGHTNTAVALKVLDPFLAQDPLSVERFVREVQIIRTLDHPNVVKVYDFLRDEDTYVICMELIDGVDGKTWLARSGEMPVAAFLTVATGVVAALEACHRVKVLHRDLKPQNILIAAGPRAKLVDFGVSRVNTMSDLTKTGTILGTADYMAPELFVSSRGDPRSDIYAAGAVFYELLTGRPPYVASSLSTLMVRHAKGEIEPIGSFRSDVPGWLEAVVLKCLRVDPSARYQSCWELRRDLERGERALAVRDARDAGVACLECKRAGVPGLPFCHHCGKLARDLYARGPCSIVLYHCDDVAGFAGQVRRLAPARSTTAVEARLARPPVVVFRGVSERAASAVFEELARVPCDLGIARRLANELRLPRSYVALGVLALVPLLAAGTVPGRLALTAAGELALAAAYLRQIRPLVRLPEVRDARATYDDAELVQVAGRLSALGDEALKTILANIVRNYLALRDVGNPTTAVCRTQDVSAIVRLALDAGHRVEGQALYLAGTSVNTIKARLEAARRRLEEAQTADDAARSVEACTALERELKSYRAVEDLHSRTYIALLNLQALLGRVVEATRHEAALDGFGIELDELKADFAPKDAAA